MSSGFSVVDSVLDSEEKELEGEVLRLRMGVIVETGRKEAESIVDKTAARQDLSLDDLAGR